jgi:hypothetical protein
MRTLVAASHARVKDYAFEQWSAATASYHRLLAIEEGEREYAESLGVPYVPFSPEENPRRQGRHRICGPLFNQAWTAILSAAGGYTHILSLDTDVIPPCDILALMEPLYDDTFDFLRHGVPWRTAYHRPGAFAYETSCTLGSVAAWQAALDETYRRGELATLYGVVGDPDLFTHRDINLVQLTHLDDTEATTEGLS